jgi:hypothetical protein
MEDVSPVQMNPINIDPIVSVPSFIKLADRPALKGSVSGGGRTIVVD